MATLENARMPSLRDKLLAAEAAALAAKLEEKDRKVEEKKLKVKKQ